MQRLEQVDPEVAKAIRQETERQSRNLELIASENFVSEAVLEAVGSVMTNIGRVLEARGDARAEAGVRVDVAALTARFPLYPERLG